MTRIRFIAAKGNRGPDGVTILLEGVEDLPKFLVITAENYFTPLATGKAYVDNGQLVIEAELREEDFSLYPVIGLEQIEERNIDGNIAVTRSVLQHVSLQSFPNPDPEILSINGQLNSGEALLMYY